MNKVKEKRKIKIFKALSILFFMASILFAVFTSITGAVDFKDYDGNYIYDSSLNKSTCAITLEFYEPVVGDFTIRLYDSSNNLLYEEEYEITEKTDYYVVNFVVTGKASRYEIDDYYFSTSSAMPIIETFSYILCVVAGICLTLSGRMKCNSYYFNGQRIVVYSNAMKCYLKVNDVIYDEQKNAGRTGTTLFTTLDNGDRVQATIYGRRITLTVNDFVCPPER